MDLQQIKHSFCQEDEEDAILLVDPETESLPVTDADGNCCTTVSRASISSLWMPTEQPSMCNRPVEPVSQEKSCQQFELLAGGFSSPCLQ